MKIFSFLLAPALWMLKIFWKIFKKSWPIGLILLYLFRIPLFSGHIIRFVQEKLQESGTKISIEKLDGSYIFGFSLHNIKLEEPVAGLEKLEIQKISVSYNFLAPFFGHRILQKITILKPAIHLQQGEEKIQNPEEAEINLWKRLKKISDMDIFILVSNSPDLSLEEAEMVFQGQKQQVSLQNFTWQNSPRKGKISCDKITLESLETKQQRGISEFLIAWSLEGRKITIEKAKVRVKDYPYPLSIPKPILLDLGTQRVNLGKFHIPLPDDGLLEGNISYEEGCQINLSHLQLNLQEILPLASVFIEQKTTSIPLYITLHLSLEFPHWDISKIRGILLLLLSENPHPQKNIALQLPENCEIIMKTEIENLKILENFLTLLYPQIQKDFISGKLSSQNQIQLLQEKIQYSGQIQCPDLCALHLPKKEFHSDWKIVWNTRDQNIHLENWKLDFLPLQLEVQADVSRLKNTQAQFKAKISSESISSFLPKSYQSLGDASLKSEWQLSFFSPSLVPTISNSKLSGESLIKIEQVKAFNHSFRDISIKSRFLLEKDKIQIEKLEVEWEGKKILSLQLQANRSGFFKGYIQLSLPEIQEYTKKYLPQIPFSLRGDALLHAHFQGTLPLEKKPWQIKARIQSKLKKAQWNTISCGDLTLFSEITATENNLLVSSLEFLQNQKSLIKGKGQHSLNGMSQLFCQISLPDLQNTVSPLFSQGSFPLKGDLFSDISLKGNVKEILSGKAWLQNQIKITLSNAKYKDFSIPELKLMISGNANQKQIYFSQIWISFNKNLTLNSKGKIGYSSGLSSELQGNLELKNPMEFLPRDIPFQTSSLKTSFFLTGKIPWKEADKIVKNRIPFSIQSNLSISMPQVKVQGFSFQNISLGAKLHANETSLNWDNLNLLWEQKPLFRSQGKLHYHTGDIETQASLSLETIEKYVPQLFQHSLAKEITGNAKAFLKLTGKIPFPHSRLSLQGRAGFRLEKGSLRKVPYQGIQIVAPFSVDQEKVVLQDMACHWDTTEILKASGQIGYQNRIPTHLQLESSLKKTLETVLLPFFPGISLSLQGDCSLKLILQGLISFQDQKIDINASLNIPLVPYKEKTEWKWEGKTIAFSGQKEKAGLFIEAHCKGSMKKPDLQGKAEFYLPKISLLQQDMILNGLFFYTSIQQEKIQIKAGLSLGGSPLDIQGEIALKDLQPKSIRLKIQGDRILLIRNTQMYSRASIDLLLEGIVEEYKTRQKFQGKLSGIIDIVECNIKVPMSLEKKAQRGPISLGYESDFLQMLLDVKISFPKILVKNNLLHVETKGNINIKGSLAKPYIQGYLATETGKLFMPQGLMEIRECIVRILPESPLKPNFNLKAATKVKDYNIFVIIQGTPENFTIEFLSSPPLAKEDILALMLTGGTRAELQQSAGKKMQETGSFILLQQFLNKIGLGAYVSAQITQEMAAITIMPPEWKGFAIQGKVEKASKVGFHFIYRLEFK